MKKKLKKALRPIYYFLKYDIVGRFNKGTYSKIAEYKNVCKGEKCFLIGSGPSLRLEDLQKLHNSNYKTFTCNSMFKTFDKVEWRPDYYCICDLGLFQTIEEKLFVAQKAPIFVNEGIYNSAVHKEKLIPIRVKVNWNYPQKRYFSVNAEQYVYPAGSVLYFMMQIAAYMGFSEIYLLGCDCNYSYTKTSDGTIKKTGDKDYFMEGYEERKGVQPFNQFDVVLPDYVAAKKYCDTHDIKIYNATRGGKLEVFERVDFDSLFS